MSLTPEIERFIRSQVESGKYASAVDVIQAGVRLLKERDRIYQGRFEELPQDVLIGVEQLERRAVIEQLRQKNQV